MEEVNKSECFQSSENEKQKLRTSKDIYNRLKWDSESLNIDLSSIYIGYKDRFMGMCEMPFNDFQPLEGSGGSGSTGDIPYHRIYYFRGGGPSLFPTIGKGGEVGVKEENLPPGSIFYWDRDKRQDLIFQSGDTKTLNLDFDTKRSSSRNQPVFKFNSDSNQWEEVDLSQQHLSNSESTISTFKLISLNVLFELCDPEIVEPTIRWPHLLNFLQTSNADIIALQEVTKSFLLLLESQSWIQNGYFLTDISSHAETVNPYGQIFLTKFQFPVSRHLFTNLLPNKRLVVGTFNINGRLLHIGNIHLSSSHRKDCSSVRKKQFHAVVDTMRGMPNWGESDIVIVGDTNFNLNESIGDVLDLELELNDAWTILRGDESGFTADVDRNMLCRKLSPRPVSNRFDRVFYKAGNIWKPTEINIKGDDAIEGTNLWISDHFALECTFSLQRVSNPNPLGISRNDAPPTPLAMFLNEPLVYTSAVVILPPPSLYDKLNSIRSEFDPNYSRWPPHITLFFRFLRDIEDNFMRAEKHVETALKSLQSFQISFSEIGVFQHSNSCTVYLAPEEEEGKRISEIYSKLLKLFPKCGEKLEHQGRVFTPHLTIAKLATGTKETNERNDALIEKWKRELLPLQFTGDRICFVSREGDSPFKIKNVIFLDQ